MLVNLSEKNAVLYEEIVVENSIVNGLEVFVSFIFEFTFVRSRGTHDHKTSSLLVTFIAAAFDR
jgi:hypothetical protein